MKHLVSIRVLEVCTSVLCVHGQLAIELGLSPPDRPFHGHVRAAARGAAGASVLRPSPNQRPVT